MTEFPNHGPKPGGLLTDDAVWSLWARRVYAAREKTPLDHLPVSERYRALVKLHQDMILKQLMERWGYSTEELDCFISEGPECGSVLPEESELFSVGFKVEFDSVHEIAKDPLHHDSLLLDALILTNQALTAIDSEDFEFVRKILPGAYKRFQIHQSQMIQRDLREKKSIGGRDGARKRWAGQEQIRDLIEVLAKQSDDLGDSLPPRELWPLLFSGLDKLGLHPKEYGSGPLGPESRYEYVNGSISWNSFRERIRLARR